MGLRFRKYITILPGVRINLTKKGVSLSLGGSGVTRNISKHGVRDTVGLPGTGLSYTTYEKHAEPEAPGKEPRTLVLYVLISAMVILSLMVAAVLVALLLNHAK
jgi:hypothetical protein